LSVEGEKIMDFVIEDREFKAGWEKIFNSLGESTSMQ
jgi:hypothetical protein